MGLVSWAPEITPALWRHPEEDEKHQCDRGDVKTTVCFFGSLSLSSDFGGASIAPSIGPYNFRVFEFTELTSDGKELCLLCL
jgi:hypothetical protein